MGNLLTELKRRNVFRVAAAYTVVAWVVAQAMDMVTNNFGAPDWVMQVSLLILVSGLPVALALSWAFEITRDGVVKSKDVPVSKSITPQTGQKLNRLTIGALVLALAFIAWDKLGSETAGTATPVTDKSVAVLPFADLSEGQDQEWFADGLTEEILNSLTRLPALLVTARTSSFEFKNTNIAIGEIARRLGVAHVVEGSVRRIGDDLRVTAQLIRAADGFHLWSETYDRKSSDLFDVQFEVAESVATALDVVLDDALHERLLQSGTRNIEAFEAFRKGVTLFNLAHERSQDRLVTLAQANEFFDQALLLDPTMAGAALLHSDRYAHHLVDSDSPIIGGEVLDDATAYALLIVDLERSAANATNPVSKLFAEINLEFFSPSWHRMSALVDELRAVLNAGEYVPVGEALWVNETLTFLGEYDLAEMLGRHRMRVDPLSSSGIMDLIDVYVRRGDFDAAKSAIAEVRGRFGNTPAVQWRAIDLELLQGNNEAAIALMTDELIAIPTYATYGPIRSALQGNIEAARRLAATLEEAGKGQTIGLQRAYTAIGDRELARQSVRRLDARTAGPALVAIHLSTQGGLFWFGLDDAPNLKQRLVEAGLDGSGYELEP